MSNKCDWIWEKLAFTHTTAKYAFHIHTIAVDINYVVTVQAGDSAETYPAAGSFCTRVTLETTYFCSTGKLIQL